MSHEIRTPLNADPRLCAAPAREREPEPASSRRVVDPIDAAASTCSTLINDILDLAQHRSRPVGDQPTPSTSRSSCDETAVARCSRRGAEKGLGFLSSGRRAGAWFDADAMRLRQVLLTCWQRREVHRGARCGWRVGGDADAATRARFDGERHRHRHRRDSCGAAVRALRAGGACQRRFGGTGLGSRSAANWGLMGGDMSRR